MRGWNTNSWNFLSYHYSRFEKVCLNVIEYRSFHSDYIISGSMGWLVSFANKKKRLSSLKCGLVWNNYILLQVFQRFTARSCYPRTCVTVSTNSNISRILFDSVTRLHKHSRDIRGLFSHHFDIFSGFARASILSKSNILTFPRLLELFGGLLVGRYPAFRFGGFSSLWLLSAPWRSLCSLSVRCVFRLKFSTLHKVGV